MTGLTFSDIMLDEVMLKLIFSQVVAVGVTVERKTCDMRVHSHSATRAWPGISAFHRRCSQEFQPRAWPIISRHRGVARNFV